MGQRIERKHRRVRARSVEAHLNAGETKIAGEVESISQSGLFVRTEELLFVGAKVQLDLVRPGGKSLLSLPGVVADMLEADRSASLGRKTGMGISFDPIRDPALTERLERLLREMAEVARPLTDPPKPAAAATSAPAAPPGADSELARLQAQVRALLIDISDLKRSVAERDAIIERQRSELELRQKVER